MYDICAIVIFVIIFVSDILRKMNRSKINNIFNVLIVLCLVSSISSLLRGIILVGGSYSKISLALSYVLQYVYLVSYCAVLPVYTLLIIAVIGIWHGFKSSAILVSTWILLTFNTVCFVFVNIFTGKVFTIDDTLRYHRGPWISVIYVAALFFTAFGTFIVIKCRKFLKLEKMVVLLLFYPIAVIGIIVQGFVKHSQIEMFCLSVATLLFSIVVHRQNEILDPVTGAKKYNAGVEHMVSIFETKTPVQVVLLKLVNYNNIRVYLGLDLYNNFLRMVSTTMRKLAEKNKVDADVFYLEYGLFAYLTEDMDEVKVAALAEELNEYIKGELSIEGLKILPDSRCCIVKVPAEINEYTTLFTFGTTFHATLPESHDVMKYSDYVNDEQFKIKNELDEIIARGLKNSSFEMYYQPIYSTTEKKFVCAEALIRLNDEKYGMISPGLFIKAAEVSGAIHAIGDFVLTDVCRFISENDFEELGLSHVQINMSASQCIEVDLVAKVKQILEENNVNPSKLNLEISESSVDFDPEVIDQNISALNEYGIHFALDDYGTGYSNVKRVTSLPIDIVKLDKAFIEDMNDDVMWIMVQDTIKMLKEMGKEVVIEGVENESVVEKFMEMGCDYIQGCEYMQGYYFCKPLPEKEFLEFMHAQA